jgi:hypothetical protein
MVWNLKKHRRSLPTTENRTGVIAACLPAGRKAIFLI